MRRFWKAVSIVEISGGLGLRLDDRVVKTPLKADLILPRAALAEAVAAEWDAVDEKIDPAAMPMTGFANAAIDRVGPERASFVESIAAYAETDCFCYRAQDQDALIERQAALWDPWLNWAAARYGVEFTLVKGIMHAPQPAETLAKLRQEVAVLTDYQLAAMAKLTHLAGSLVAALAIFERAGDAPILWDALCLDEDWQAENWGADDFAIKHRRDRERDFLDAARFLAFVRG